MDLRKLGWSGESHHNQLGSYQPGSISSRDKGEGQTQAERSRVACRRIHSAGDSVLQERGQPCFAGPLPVPRCFHCCGRISGSTNNRETQHRSIGCINAFLSALA